jgi:hypothetical protein
MHAVSATLAGAAHKRFHICLNLLALFLGGQEALFQDLT